MPTNNSTPYRHNTHRSSLNTQNPWHPHQLIRSINATFSKCASLVTTGWLYSRARALIHMSFSAKLKRGHSVYFYI